MVERPAAELDELETVRERHANRTQPHLCESCRERRSLFRYGDTVRADHDHTLCFRCHRALCDRMRARLLTRAA